MSNEGNIEGKLKKIKNAKGSTDKGIAVISLAESIYSSIPDEVKKGIQDKTLHLLGNVIYKKNKPQGLIQSTVGILGNQNTKNAISSLSQFSAIGAKAHPIAMGIHAAGEVSILALQMEEIKKNLEGINKKLDKINAKIDFGYHSKFTTALDLTKQAKSINKREYKTRKYQQAIQLFAETKNIYSQYINQELENDGRMLSEYFLIVIFSYIGQIKCYLELEEIETAQIILDESALKIKSLAVKYINLLLSENPAIYLHNDFKDLDIDLEKLTKVYNWLGDETNENQLFKKLRDNYIEIHSNQDKAIKEIPKIVWDPILDIEIKEESSYFSKLNPLAMFQGIDNKPFLKNRLRESFDTIEKMMEACDRFSSIKYEMELMSNEGISYSQWQQRLEGICEEGSEMMYVKIETPIYATA